MAAEAVSLDAWERRLNVRRRARADAARGAPAPGEAGLSEAEREIIAAIAAAEARFTAEREAAAAQLEAQLRRTPIPEPQIGPDIALARLELARIEGREGPAMRAAAASAADARAALAAFRKEHRLLRPAIYPASSLLAAGLLALAAVLEAAFSATLFADAEGVAGGYLQGGVIALGLSGANVAMGFFAGFLGLRYLQHVGLWRRIGGAVAFASALAAAFALNAFAALWRERLTAEAAYGEAGGWLDQLSHLTSPQAVILLMLGGMVWIFSALKGYSGVDDPYPDYGRLHRALARAEDALADARDDAREALEAPVEAIQTRAQAVAKALGEAVQARRRLFEAAAGKLAEIDARARALEAVQAGLIALYRRENRAARRDPAPAGFDAPPPPLNPIADVLGPAADMTAAGEAQAAAAQQRLMADLTALGRDLETAQSRLDPDAAAPREEPA